jgi:hypothetical protein
MKAMSLVDIHHPPAGPLSPTSASSVRSARGHRPVVIDVTPRTFATFFARPKQASWVLRSPVSMRSGDTYTAQGQYRKTIRSSTLSFSESVWTMTASWMVLPPRWAGRGKEWGTLSDRRQTHYAIEEDPGLILSSPAGHKHLGPDPEPFTSARRSRRHAIPPTS